MIRVICCTFALCLATVAFGQAWMPGGDLGRDRVILTDRDAIVLCPPALAAAPHVSRVDWSPSGAYLLAWRQESSSDKDVWAALHAGPNTPYLPSGKPSALVAWNRATGRIREVWSSPKAYDTPEANWLGLGSVALIAVTELEPVKSPDEPLVEHTRLLRVDADSGRVETIAYVDTSNAGSIRVLASPTKSFAIVSHAEPIRRQVTADTDGSSRMETAGWNITLSRVGATGTMQTLTTFQRARGSATVIWAEDGMAALQSFRRQENQKPRTVEIWQRLDTRNGSLTDLPTKPKPLVQEGEPSIRVFETKAGVGAGGAAPPVPVLWLESTDRGSTRAFLATEATKGLVAPNGKSVAYQSRGALWVTRLERMPRAAFEEGWQKAVQSRAINNAKQLGLGILMYANDNNETYPSSQDVASLIGPYLGGTSMCDGFVYVQDGGRLADIEAPAETVIGYLPAPGGRAVMYADGHVKWWPETPATPKEKAKP